jgi:AraC-like DNA-binding protein
MVSLIHTPGPPLSGFVDNLWSFSDVPLHAKERIVPSGTLELVINLHEDELRIYDSVDAERCKRFSGAMVSGAYRGFFVIDTREHASVMGVHFKPGGALPFLGAPPGALADTHVDLEALWGRRPASVLRERLCAAAAPAHRFRILEEALLERLLRPVRRHRAVQAALHQLAHGRSVHEVAADVNLSHRRFIEVFTAETGLTPKLFARVRRFQRALALAAHASPDWSQLALECGFFDQSHMIRDFVDFSGFSPAELLHHRSEHVRENHLALSGDVGSNSSNTRVSSGL